jgi:hypothetical protein
VQDNTDVPEPPEIVVVLSVHVSPLLGETVVARLTVPVKPFNADTAIVEFPLVPEFMLTIVGLVAIVKSRAALNVKVAVAEWVKDPLVPVTVSL